MNRSTGAGEPLEQGSDLERTCFRNLMESSNEIIYFKDRQSRFIRLSKAWGKLAGQDPQQLLGLTDFDIQDPDHAAEAFADEQQIIATGRSMVDKYEREAWPGQPDRWVSSTKMPLQDAEGQIIGTFGISRDITRLVRAEEESSARSAELEHANAEIRRIETQLRTVLDTSADAIALYDAHRRYQYVNSASERILELDIDQLLGRTDREVAGTGTP